MHGTTRNFDVEKVASLINEELPALASVCGKDISLCIGKSGSGKSSLICFLRENKMVLREDESGDNWVDSEFPDPNFLIGDQMGVGVTKRISIGTIPGSDLLIGDTCGLWDPQGTIDAEVDIANAVTIHNAMRRSNSVRPVLVCKISIFDDRGSSFIQLLLLLATCFSPIEKYFESITFFFTGGNPKAKLKSLLESPLVKDDILGAGVLENFVKKLHGYVISNEHSCVIRPKDLVAEDAAVVAVNRMKYLELIKQAIPIPISAMESVGCPLSQSDLLALSNKCLSLASEISQNLRNRAFDKAWAAEDPQR